jgi:alpha-galactosidase
VPWFVNATAPAVGQFNIARRYIRRCEAQIAAWRIRNTWKAWRSESRRNHEYGSLIIHSIETGEPRIIYGNLPNGRANGALIENLPRECCVEVPCRVDRSGVQPLPVGALPPQLAALMQTNINVQALTVEAALTGRRAHVYHAAMLDPHTAAELSLDQIHGLVDDLLAAHGDWVPALT